MSPPKSSAAIYQAIGGAAGCHKLAEAFYGRVAQSPILKPFFPGKSMRCAIEEFSAFLIQFLDAPGPDSQFRWRVSLRESHAKFKIGPSERDEWLRLMNDTLNNAGIDDSTRTALREFFEQSSKYIIKDSSAHANFELAPQWSVQVTLDEAIQAIRNSDAKRAIPLANQLDPPRRIGLIVEMIGSTNPELHQYVLQHLDPTAQYAGRTLLHTAAAKGRLEIVEALLAVGADPNAKNPNGHPPLYDAANQHGTAAIIRTLVHAGADVNTSGALHMAARRGNVEVAEALLDAGADINARDNKRDTPLQRAINCKKPKLAALLAARGGVH